MLIRVKHLQQLILLALDLDLSEHFLTAHLEEEEFILQAVSRWWDDQCLNRLAIIITDCYLLRFDTERKRIFRHLLLD